MKKRMVSMLVAMVMVFALLPTVALADFAPDYISEDYTVPLDFEDSGTHKLEGENLSGDGWDWNAETKTLTLNGFQGGEIDFGSYYGLKIVLVEGSVNTIHRLNFKPSSSGVVIEGTGKLIIKSVFTINAYEGPVTIADSLQLMGRSKYNAPLEPVTIAYDRAWGKAVMANGDDAKYIEICPADPSTSTSSTPDSDSAPSFTDVPNWCSDAVDWAVEKEITNGTTLSTFSPNQTCTQAHILTFLWRAAGEPQEGIKTPVANVDEDDYFYQAVMWANDMGMIDPGTFDPGKLCTRSQAVRYICQAFAVPYQSPVNSGFADVPAGADYASAVAWAVENGITNGTSPTTFGPNDTCSRGQIVTFLHRAYVPSARLSVN